MITIKVDHTQYQLIMQSISIAKNKMKSKNLQGVVSLLEELEADIGMHETQESSKTHESKNVL